MTRSRLAAFALALAGFASPLALAQSDYPNRPITMVVPFPPGGVADITGPRGLQCPEMKNPPAKGKQ